MHIPAYSLKLSLIPCLVPSSSHCLLKLQMSGGQGYVGLAGFALALPLSPEPH